MTKKQWLYAIVVCVFSLSSVAQEDKAENVEETNESQTQSEEQAPTQSSIQLQTTSVTGSRELPKVMVIVPWKTSESVSPGERPLASLVEEALTPLDPDVFRRELDYYTELSTTSAQDADASKK